MKTQSNLICNWIVFPGFQSILSLWEILYISNSFSKTLSSIFKIALLTTIFGTVMKEALINSRIIIGNQCFAIQVKNLHALGFEKKK